MNLGKIWFDIEEWPSGSATIIQQNVVFLEAAAKAVTDNGWEGGIYCGREWPSLFGNYTGLSNWPLWYNPPEPRYAHYDNVPSFIDWPGTPYGGWTFPTFKQYWDGGAAVCDTNLDQDWGPALPWST